MKIKPYLCKRMRKILEKKLGDKNAITRQSNARNIEKNTLLL